MTAGKIICKLMLSVSTAPAHGAPQVPSPHHSMPVAQEWPGASPWFLDWEHLQVLLGDPGAFLPWAPPHCHQGEAIVGQRLPLTAGRWVTNTSAITLMVGFQQAVSDS